MLHNHPEKKIAAPSFPSRFPPICLCTAACPFAIALPSISPAVASTPSPSPLALHALA